jgi:aryl-alcohol dehydrogenase-like predicted oxidoreductase
MKYRLFGKSGLKVAELCLGAMTFGKEWGPFGASKDESEKIFRAYEEAGGNFIDTANKYMEGTSEKFLAKFLKGKREKFVLATKYTLALDFNDPNGCGNSRKNMVQSLEASLTRLNTDYVDIYWVHAWDFLTPIEEVMRALDDMVRAGKVLYVGISDTPAWIISRANTYAELSGLTPFTGIQTHYNLIERTSERDLLPMAQALDLAVTAWSPLGGGLLTGKYGSGEKEKAGKEGKRYGPDNLMADQFITNRNLSIAEEAVRIAGEAGRTPAQVSLRWLIQQQDRGVIIPILGARTVEQMLDNLGCLDFTLSEAEMKSLDKASSIELGFPHDFLSLPFVKGMVYGESYPEIEVHRGRKP